VRRARIVRELGAVPAYATTAAGAPEDVEPEQKRRRTRRGSLIAPEEPGQQLSRDEFQELVRDLDVDGKENGSPAAPPASGGGRRARTADSSATVAPPAPPAASPEGERDPAADLTPEDLVLKEDAKQRQKSRRTGARRNKRHGRAR
jgi:hypothetical protein